MTSLVRSWRNALDLLVVAGAAALFVAIGTESTAAVATEGTGVAVTAAPAPAHREGTSP